MAITQIIQDIVLLSIILFAFLATKTKNLFIAVLYLGVMNLMLAVEFYILQAPDVAITETVIEAGLSTAIFIMAIHKIRVSEKL